MWFLMRFDGLAASFFWPVGESWSSFCLILTHRNLINMKTQFLKLINGEIVQNELT